MDNLNIKVVGIGGVGGLFVDKVSRFLNYQNKFDVSITLIDGDEYQPKNLERQEFFEYGNKSFIKSDELSKKFTSIKYDNIQFYVNEGNIETMIHDKDIVILSVDNHRTRKIVSDYVSGLNDIILISGGNEFYDGNVQLFVKKGNKNITPRLTDYHPEIEHPKDKSPEEMSCEELSKSEPQLFFANLSVATIMCWMFYNVVILNNVKISEIYFDMEKMNVAPKVRKTKTI